MKILLNIDLIESKKKVFAYIDQSKNPTEEKVRALLKEKDIKTFDLLATGEGFMVFSTELKVNTVDLTTSYGASSLEAAPPEITDPEPQPKPKTTRRRRTRKTTPKTTK